ncbi:MAG: hypothetical protein IKJ58_02150 [Akkermansia sp.]|nr:hypothetical protein [Akkermansia sp.]
MDEEINIETPVETGETEVPEVVAETPVETPAEPEETVNPFDFTAEPEEESEASEEPEPEPGDYQLDFGEAFGGNDTVRGMITKHAREAGISVEAGSKFVSAVCKSLQADAVEKGEAAYKQLEDSWGAEFDRNMKGTKAALHSMLKAGVISESEVSSLMNPAVFKLVHHLRSRMGEGAALGTKQAAKEDPATEYARIMNDTKSHEFQVLMNPSHPEYKAIAERVNKLVGRRLY